MTIGLVQIGKSYEHYKGNVYRVVAVGKMEATLEDVVVYQSLDHGSPVWVRPIAEFFAEVDWEGKRIPRFRLIDG